MRLMRRAGGEPTMARERMAEAYLSGLDEGKSAAVGRLSHGRDTWEKHKANIGIYETFQKHPTARYIPCYNRAFATTSAHCRKNFFRKRENKSAVH